MEVLLKPDDITVDRRRLVLGGMGGIGKSQLAIAYAKRHRQLYESIFWLNATTQQTLQASLQKLAQRILESAELQHYDSDQLVVYAFRWLSESDNTRWLLIYDNYDEPNQYRIAEYFPSASHGTIIITTRLPDQVSGLQIKVQHLQDVEDSLQILQTRSERRNVQSGKLPS